MHSRLRSSSVAAVTVALILLGIVSVNVFKQAQGPRYEVTAKVLRLKHPPPASSPERSPSSIRPEFSRRHSGSPSRARSTRWPRPRARTPTAPRKTWQSDVTVAADPSSDLIAFTASNSDSAEAVGMANSVARGYIDFRTKLAAAQVASTIQG